MERWRLLWDPRWALCDQTHEYCRERVRYRKSVDPVARDDRDVDTGKAHLSNVSTILGTADDPKLPNGQVDSVVILNAYHEIEHYQEMLRHIYDALKPGGRVEISEPSPPSGEETRAWHGVVLK